MNAIAFPLLTLFLSAGPASGPENTVLTDLVTKGVAMPDGQVVMLPAPRMPDGLTPAQQMQALKNVTLDSKDKSVKGKVDAFLNNGSQAPILMRIFKQDAKNGTDLIRSIEVCFVVYGDWDVLNGKEFSDGILKEGKSGQKAGGDTEVLKAGYLKTPAMAVRSLSARSTANMKEYFLYTTFRLFAQVEVSATRFGMATTSPTGVVVASMVDRRFTDDKVYSNEWRVLNRNAAGAVQPGPPNPYTKADPDGYSSAGFYAKVTRLSAPTNAIFVEYHSTFYEPQGWFGPGAENLLPTELKKIIPFQVKQFRIKLAKATEAAAAAKAAGAQPAANPPVEAEKPAETKTE